jgi:hypothetical protein
MTGQDVVIAWCSWAWLGLAAAVQDVAAQDVLAAICDRLSVMPQQVIEDDDLTADRSDTA